MRRIAPRCPVNRRNGRPVATHLGGYLPFTMDLKLAADNTVTGTFGYPGYQTGPVKEGKFGSLAVDELTVRQLRIARGERPMGYKIGFTNRNIWPRYQVFAPIWGTVWNTTLAFCDGEGEVSLAGTLHPRLEPEAVFGLARTPPARAAPGAGGQRLVRRRGGARRLRGAVAGGAAQRSALLQPHGRREQLPDLVCHHRFASVLVFGHWSRAAAPGRCGRFGSWSDSKVAVPSARPVRSGHHQEYFRR